MAVILGQPLSTVAAMSLAEIHLLLRASRRRGATLALERLHMLCLASALPHDKASGRAATALSRQLQRAAG